jgi:hypothetical protein
VVVAGRDEVQAASKKTKPAPKAARATQPEAAPQAKAAKTPAKKAATKNAASTKGRDS